MEDILNHIFDKWHPTGSHYICNPPVTDTDIDYICYYPYMDETFVMLLEGGWTYTNPDEVGKYEGMEKEFFTFRRGNYNLIVTTNRLFYSSFVLATEIAKDKNILDKQERIKLFRHHLYGEPYETNIRAYHS